MDLKMCSTCKSEKQLEDFEVRKSYGKEYRRGVCRACRQEDNLRYKAEHPGDSAISAKTWRENNPGKAREQTRKWREDNRESVNKNQQRYRRETAEKQLIYQDSHSRYHKTWRKNNSEKIKHYTLKSTYGISLADYKRLHTRQGGVCAICAKPESRIEPRTGEPRLLAVDHCHASGLIRGLLCADCNTALGLLREKTELFQSAISYIQLHEQS